MRPQAAMAQKPGPAGAAFEAVLQDALNVVGRLTSVVTGETAALRRGEHSALADFNYRKGHGLLELSRAMETLSRGHLAHPDLAGALRGLQETLCTNQTVLKMHLDAVHEITGTLASVIRERESDGTYGRGIARGSFAP